MRELPQLCSIDANDVILAGTVHLEGNWNAIVAAESVLERNAVAGINFRVQSEEERRQMIAIVNDHGKKLDTKFAIAEHKSSFRRVVKVIFQYIFFVYFFPYRDNRLKFCLNFTI